MRTLYPILQGPRNQKSSSGGAVSTRGGLPGTFIFVGGGGGGGLPRGKGRGRESCLLESYLESQQLHKQVRQFRAAALVGDGGKGPREQGA